MDTDHSSSAAPDQKDTTNDWSEMMKLLHEVRRTSYSDVSSVEDVPGDGKNSVFHPVVGDGTWTDSEERTNYLDRDPHEAHGHVQPTHLPNVLERGLAGIKSEVAHLHISVLHLVYGMIECDHTMRFLTTRMQELQKEMITTASETTQTLQRGVHLLQELMAKHEPCLADKSTNRRAKPGPSAVRKSKRGYGAMKTRSSDAKGLRHSKRHKMSHI
ncbi:uncharacterized protein ACNLHF_012179 [Anomaloglossus baeobatrachus]|uniref:uncharacterized protein LOC142295769 n=1 Tax=Anomaloglossus baeobatrachus TaxID=238106 RepID=UPI003F4FFFEE